MNMRKIIVFILLLAMLGCWGTDQGPTRTYTFTVKNESGKNIQIKAYLSSYPDVTPIITSLPIGKEIVKKNIDHPPYFGYSFQDFFGTMKSPRDSMVVIFDMAKIVSFNNENCDDNRNPLNFCEYRNLEETFIFTEQDYENAEPCNGNCD